VVGHARYALIYFVSLLGGSFGALLLQPHGFTVGASGAVFGLAGAGFLILRHRGVDPMQSGLGFFILFNLLISFATPRISIGGHLGGLVAGALVAWLLYYAPERVRLPGPAPLLLSAALGAAAVAGSFAIAGSGA
jgi:membrane associated rhomboid family serine protease